MKFSQSIFLFIVALFIAANIDAVQSISAKKRKKNTTHQIKFDDIKLKQNAELGHSYGLQSYPCKYTFPENTQASPTTWTSRMGNQW